MNSAVTQPQTPVWKKLVGVFHGSLDGMYAARNNWHASSLRTILPKRQPAEETGIYRTTMNVPKRQREGSAKTTSPNWTASQNPGPTSAHASLQADISEPVPLPQVTPEIVQNMQKIAEYRKKQEILKKKTRRWELLHDNRKEKVWQLEEELDQLAASVDADSESLRNIRKLLEQSRAAYEESDQRVTSLRGSLMAYRTNAEFAVVELEDALGQLLSDGGLLNDQFSDSEVSEHESIRSTKRARTNASSVERFPSPDPAVEKKRDAVVLLHETRVRCQEIEADFENRSELYRDGLERWQELIAAGDFSMTRTELDVQWCRRYGNLGLDLWEAEIARSEAAVAVMRLNALPISYSQTSKFADDPEDAAGLEHEAERAMATLDASKVEDWLRSIEEQSPVDQLVELEPDDWDVQSLQLGESCSGIADGWIKIRLQRWDTIREILWNATKSSLGGEFALPSGNFIIEVDPTGVESAVPPSELQG